MKKRITNHCSIRYSVKNALRAVLIGLGVLKFTVPLCAQSGVYALSGGSASLAGITNSTSTADQAGIYVYNSGTLTVGTVSILNVDSSRAAILTVSAASLSGNLIADSTSTITNTLQNGATLTGQEYAINF